VYIVFSTSAAYENYVSVSGIADSDDAESVQEFKSLLLLLMLLCTGGYS